MKLRYYLRGLGIGIVITAILMGVATGDNGQMTDAEIKERAAQLGMVEQKVLADITENVKPVEDILQPSISPTVPPEVIEDSKNSEGAQVGEATEAPADAGEPEATEVPEDTGEPEATDLPKDTIPPDVMETQEVVQLTIRSGASSWTVSKDLAAYGLVADAAEFDKYLSREGYDKSICVGEFSIQMGAGYEEIAKIITKRH